MKNIISIVALVFVVSALSSINGQEPTLPSRNPEDVLPLLFPFDNSKSYSEIEAILGLPDYDHGSGIYVLYFTLIDSTSIIVGTPDKNSVMYINHVENNS